MAVEARPAQPDDLLREERSFGGDIVGWVLLLVFSMPIVMVGLSQAPQVGGFLLMIIGGIAAGISFAQIILRLPYLTHRFMFSVLIVIVLAAVIALSSQIYSTTLPVTKAVQDTMYKPPISGG